MSPQKKFGQYIANRRKSLGLTQDEVLDQISMILNNYESVASIASLKRWESGTNFPENPAAIKALAIVYNDPNLFSFLGSCIELSRKKKPPVREHRRFTVRPKFLLPSV